MEYVATGVAIGGAGLAGYEFNGWQSSVVPAQTRTVTETVTQTLSKTTTETLRLASLHGRLFFDYNGNGKQDGEEPAVAGALVQLKDSSGNTIAQALTDSSGDYRLEDMRTGLYKLHLGVEQFSDKQFTHMCASPDQFRAITDDYDVSLEGTTSINIGLMEGFLTLPMSRDARYETDRFYDRDPDPDKYMWWNGRSGYDRNLKRGYSPNHPGIDYYMEEGNPLLSPAPGIVDSIGEDEGGKYIFIRHPNGLKTSCGHISRAVVKIGDRIPRGRVIAMSGKSGKDTELANYPHNHFQLIYRESIALDPYSPTFEMTPRYSGYYDYSGGIHWVSMPVDSNPNMTNHWTKRDDPQFSMT